MANIDKFVAALCFVASVLTLVVGLLHVIDSVSSVVLNIHCREVLAPDCNAGWRHVFTLKPNEFVEMWTPAVLGLVASSLHVAAIRQWTPKSNLVMALLMAFVGVFGDFGYMGMLGVFTGFLSMLSALLCVLCYFGNHSSPSLLPL
eukprot:TRINITY_DN24171_c0_g1_i1.p1 TRINITY_DN24171_c0_g1~~TRINITY_DN24171_c0_g1_i1.p1  ORF type:complete len:168 (+),score=40.26 TRINITY_DN24171_c0_g1_i1:69-506(+)